ncbi:MAG: hypothetical protein IJY58_00435 [Alphaproteobacteria bacterium]|nr:hypothetical protein [Alphaproteobacteria bacterium]
MTQTFSIKTQQPQFSCLPIIDICSCTTDDVSSSSLKSHNTPTKTGLSAIDSVPFNQADTFRPICLSRFSDSSSYPSVHMGVVYAYPSYEQNKNKTDSYQSQIIHIKHEADKKNIPVHVYSSQLKDKNRYSAKSLLNRCIQWLNHISGQKIIWRSLNRAGTLILVIPNRGIYFVQFVPLCATQNSLQIQFEADISPIPVHIFHTLDEFILFIKGVTQYDA